MAGGMDWFRWHHGSVLDPKFQLIAKKSGVRLGDVIAVWAFVLEGASAESDRGSIGHIDFESLDCVLGVEDGVSSKIFEAMQSRGLVVNQRVASWEKRQPKRERPDDYSSDRTKAFRQRERQETPKNAGERQKRPRREEKRREEKTPTATPDGFAEFWSAYPKKVGKGEAEKVWGRIKPDDTLLQTMLSAIAKAKTSRDWLKDSGQFIPHPTTWLNRKQWEDGIDVDLTAGGQPQQNPMFKGCL